MWLGYEDSNRSAMPQQIGFEFAEHIRHIQNLVATTGFEPVTPSL